ncbi:tRNA pseudouridine(55) synthase TruB [Profundibacterium mesophilum]|uniref:tRNA pseudouridine synthase B n=1 Tax=Profundibacterium mesophilum KAUST100406-0324 TaxID=1037889 RepID=A0A921NZT7_9RHOB|nr:tRNA pseudouridine(55) synthase TruB [Profundibacterium mesophilum]KAF0676568.1 tRNA pseudouridine synthase B [Profundibacterium mesophilum KAUST100406-0324]
MARRRKGRDISGWVIVDKPAGMTSTAVVNKLRWAFEARKAGHAGTLDPDATGILAVAFGEATKTVPHIADALKAYEFTIRFGQATDTDDAEGRVIASSEARPSDAQIADALPALTGDIAQTPPQYSAVKIDGERAYVRARAGEAVEIAARPLHVDELVMTARPDDDHAVLRMVCGKGGYVRAIARDLGEMLGCHAHVRSLRRIWSGPFELEDAVTLEALEAHARTERIDDFLHPIEVALVDLPQVRCTQEAARALRNGNPAQVLSSEAEFGETCWASHQGAAVAIGTYRAGMIHPSRVLLPHSGGAAAPVPPAGGEAGDDPA